MNKDLGYKKKQLKRDGTSRSQRDSISLDPDNMLNPDNIKIDDRTIKDMLFFSKGYAKELIYFDSLNNPSYSWEKFFDYEAEEIAKDIEKLLGDENKNNISDTANYKPHLALFVCFLKLFNIAQNTLNSLTKKHLDFYYKEILRLNPRPLTPDKVHVIFELAKNVSDCAIKNNTELDAGKDPEDSEGKKLIYKVESPEEEIIFNNAGIKDKYSVYIPTGGSNKILYATVANSSDGIGGKLDPLNSSWDAFGNEFLPEAKIGFALASPVLLMNEGSRTVIIDIDFDEIYEIPALDGNLPDVFEIYFSGKSRWLGPYTDAKTIFSCPEKNKYKLTITQDIPSSEEAILDYDQNILPGNLNTSSPVIQFYANKDSAAYNTLKSAKVNSIKISVKVNGITSLNLENDSGVIDSKKAFMPFGPVPITGSRFYVGYDEVMNKKIDNYTFDVEWLDAPKSFADHYKKYTSPCSPVNNSTFKAYINIKDITKTSQTTDLFNNIDATQPVTWPFTDILQIILSANYHLIKYTSDEKSFFQNPNFNYLIYDRSFKFSQLGKITKSFSPRLDTSKGFIQFELQHSFYHKEFPSQYAIKMKRQKVAEDLPKEPYTPTIKTFSFNYESSTSSIKPNNPSFSEFIEKEIQLFHLGVFGNTEEHGYLKSLSNFIHDKNTYLLPQYPNEGEFYFSLVNVSPGESVRVLFQLSEGSSDADISKRNVSWSILCGNEWEKFSDEELPEESTNCLLTSGIIRFAIPAEATNDNTRLAAGKYWIRASIESQVKGVCKFINLHAQAVLAKFDSRDDTKHHLPELNSGSISKLIEKDSRVKKILQPYASFGGFPPEDDLQFYVRVSERLRHKQRSWTLWDYEHIVLQEFSKIYKVKCINHAATETADFCCNDLAPGNVLLVVIPSLKNQTFINPFQPKASSETLDKIKSYLQARTSMFINIQVQNPDYEEIQLEMFAEFKNMSEFGYYQKKLTSDIEKSLSPWAFDITKEISFGGKVYKSKIINFISKLEYVDFITQVKMFHIKYVNDSLNPGKKKAVKSNDLDEISESNERAILVSGSVLTSTSHIIKPYSEDILCS